MKRGGYIACLGAALAALPARSPADEWQKALTGPLSPGSVALLVEHRNEPGVRERWAAAMKDERPELRAAAARAIQVSGSTWLLPDLLAALAQEADGEAVVEEIRAIGSLGNASTEAALVAAATRLKAPAVDVVAETLGRTRGADAFAHLQALKSAGLSPAGYADLARMAVRAGAGDTTRAAMAAVREADALAWRAVLAEALHTQSPVDTGLLTVALGMQDARFRALAYWHLARQADRGVAIPPAVVAALGSTPEAMGKEPHDLDAQFAFEILQRTQGRKPREVSGWAAQARGGEESVVVLPAGYDDPMLKRLTAEERAAVRPPGAKEWKPPPSAKPALRGPEGPMIWMTTSFPRRFAPDLIAFAGCDPGPNDLVGGLIKYEPDGRPGHVSIRDAGLSVKCLEVARALLLSALAPLGDTTREFFVVVPLAHDVLACGGDEGSSRGGGSARTSPRAEGIGGRILEPKKLVNVPPVYPETAKRARVQGIVILEATISPSGCVTEVKVLEGVPMLNAAALNAVVRWRYTPTLLDGRPVPVIMTVTVNFRLS